MRPDRGALAVDGVHSARYGRRKTDAVFSVADVVVHCLRHRDDLHALSVEFGRIAQGVITANRDQAVESQRIDVL